MALNRHTSPELQPGQDDSAQAPHSLAQPAVLRPHVQPCEATVPVASLAQSQVAPSPRLAPAVSGLSRSRQDPRARSQADALPRQPSETQAQPHFGFAAKTHRVVH